MSRVPCCIGGVYVFGVVLEPIGVRPRTQMEKQTYPCYFAAMPYDITAAMVLLSALLTFGCVDVCKKRDPYIRCRGNLQDDKA